MAIIKAPVAVMAEIIEKITVYVPPIKNPIQRNIAAIVINKIVDNIINTSYNISRVPAPSLLGTFPYRLRFLLAGFLRWRFFFLLLKLSIKAIVLIKQLHKLKKAVSQSLNSTFITHFFTVTILRHTNSSMSIVFWQNEIIF